MKIKYFQDTDTLYIELRTAEVAETKDLDDNTLLDLDRNGDICAITIEHASEHAEIPKFFLRTDHRLTGSGSPNGETRLMSDARPGGEKDVRKPFTSLAFDLVNAEKAGLVFVKTPMLQGGSMWLIADLRR
jgi:uncharacterized protein YuzE